MLKSFTEMRYMVEQGLFEGKGGEAVTQFGHFKFELSTRNIRFIR